VERVERKKIKLILLHELTPFSKMPLDRTSDPTVEAHSDVSAKMKRFDFFSFPVAMGKCAFLLGY
jgi:hypothetical protein